ncbi:MAG: ABC transporter ATP-binding protein [Firmicutes bacterium]|nr:ABC transporter ATP-binding protein [Bacillota bacterium]
MELLQLEGICVSYGRIEALRQVSLHVHEGEIVALLGANGAGKTTTLRAISGLIKPQQGDILFDGSSLLASPAHRIVGQGIAQCPEGRRVFPTLTVEENLRLGAYLHRKDKEWVQEGQGKVWELFPRLHERRFQLAGTLSGGEQQMLAIARALMARPRLLLLDEPSLGLAPLLVQEIFRTIRAINAQGVTILLVEQNARLALKIAHRAYVLATGRVAVSGDAADLANDEKLRKAYLGAAPACS